MQSGWSQWIKITKLEGRQRRHGKASAQYDIVHHQAIRSGRLLVVLCCTSSLRVWPFSLSKGRFSL